MDGLSVTGSIISTLRVMALAFHYGPNEIHYCWQFNGGGSWLGRCAARCLLGSADSELCSSGR